MKRKRELYLKAFKLFNFGAENTKENNLIDPCLGENVVLRYLFYQDETNQFPPELIKIFLSNQ